jgi:hypothetical protein
MSTFTNYYLKNNSHETSMLEFLSTNEITNSEQRVPANNKIKKDI